MTAITLEICVESFDDALMAVAHGADRIEYCSALAVGGLTPTPGAMMRLRDIAAPCMVMIRPRPGDFVYGARDIAMMRDEIALARDAGAAGVVFGVTDANGALDADHLDLLCQSATGLEKILHRAFDGTPDPYAALETAIDLGFDRILTSGQQADALQGADLIAGLITRAAGRIGILPGCGVGPENAARILHRTGATQIHASCKRPVDDAGYAAGRTAVDGGLVRALKDAIRV
ncbi:copper homeostasis protein CutC [Thalassospira sp.]|uniref:copper homeostasis protein CutC n=1 Tax=Thalassospira sp. TaxID=1912094 RepID=UPI0027338E3B|nr:copper homeostasis protein CutC [Thalassospira sp.]MDP2698764.1 copper homeostasis protein CutC [Thalassospira sp.]